MISKISFAVTRSDLLRLSWVSLRSHPFVLAQSIGFFVGLPWAVFIWMMVNAARGVAHVSTLAMAEMLLLPLASVVAFGAIPLWISRGAKFIGANQTTEFTDEGFHFSRQGINAHISWSALTKCYGTRHGLLFYSGNLIMASIPGRVLEPEALAELRALLTSHGIKVVGPWARG